MQQTVADRRPRWRSRASCACRSQTRLQPFDDAAAKLREAGMRDIPSLYASGVTAGKIHPQSFFNTYMNDAVRNVHQNL